jgi:fermentation-respiration switch protein FrsA (DUF1100 family)
MSQESSTMKKSLQGKAMNIETMSRIGGSAAVKKVTFASNGETLVGDLYLPESFTEGSKLPGVVVTGAWMTVKEQMAATYAKQMAQRGYAALAFDFRNWGQSAGKDRQLENPKSKTEDIIAAAEFLSKQPDIDGDKVAGMGICASAGYMVNAAVESDVLQAIALIAPWLHDQTLVDDVYGGKANVSDLIAISRQAEAKYNQTGALTLAPAASDSDESAIMHNAPNYTDPERGMIPEWRNEFNLASWEGWLTFDSIALADRLTKPVLIVHSETAAIPNGAHQFYDRLKGPKKELWLNGVTQFDFYDKRESYVAACDAAADYLRITFG